MLKGPEPDVAAERAVLAGIFSFGSEGYYDVCDILTTPDAFTVDSNINIYKCLQHIYEKDGSAAVDYPAIISASSEIGLSHFFATKAEEEHLRAIFNTPVKKDNIRRNAAKLRKLQIGRIITRQLYQALKNVSEIRGDESVDSILAMAEAPLFEIQQSINEVVNSNQKMSEGVTEYVEYLEGNPVDIIGISTGYPRLDAALGGGLMRQEVDVVAARMKVGKSQIVDNVACFIAEKLNIPVLNIDTEMSKEQHWHRILANMSNIEIDLIKTGKFSKNKADAAKVKSSAKRLEKMPYYYECVCGKPIEDIVSIIRRWIMKVVGIDENGRTKDCVIIYDYFKLMSADVLAEMQETQALGFQMMQLKTIVAKYDVPVLAFAQLNRDGISKEDTSGIGFSDRIAMFCSSVSLFKVKTPEEIGLDGIAAGNRKMITLIARNGPGMDPQDYVNYNFEGKYGRITEGKSYLELEKDRKLKDGFKTTEDFGATDI